MHLASRLKTWAQSVKRNGITLWFAARHLQAPWYAKALGVLVVAYALSPIDLIPDFIPVLGCVDDLLLLPGMIWLAIRLIPAPVLQQCRDQADLWIKSSGGKPTSRIGAVLVVAVGKWLAHRQARQAEVIEISLDAPAASDKQGGQA